MCVCVGGGGGGHVVCVRIYESPLGCLTLDVV